jgi:hypothetical protein
MTGIWDREIEQARREAARAEQLRRQIAATLKAGQENPQLETKDRLRELGREHYRITGAGGGA